MRMVRDLGLAAIGARLEAQLRAQEPRLKPAETTAKAENIADPTVQFVLPAGTTRFPQALSNDTGTTADSNPTQSSASDVGVGATFRRRGLLSDVPMIVARVGDGVVVTSFDDGEATHEMAFDVNEIDVVTKAPIVVPSLNVEYFPNLIGIVKKATPVAETTTAAELPPVEAAAKMAEEKTAATSSSTPAAAGASTASPDKTLPAGAIRLPNGTVQFPYAPTGSVPGRGAVVQPPVPPEFGVGATFRRKGVADVPMTVTRVGNGVLMGTVSFPTEDGRREMAFIPDQLELVTPAPTGP